MTTERGRVRCGRRNPSDSAGKIAEGEDEEPSSAYSRRKFRNRLDAVIAFAPLAAHHRPRGREILCSSSKRS
jgi:hypothetical protein